MSGTFVVRILQ